MEKTFQLSTLVQILLAIGFTRALQTASYAICPENTQDNNSCLILSQYAQNSSQYFVENSTFIFLSGEHTLNVSIILDSVSNITLSGEPDVTITCRGPANIQCRNVTNLTISSLKFESCGSGEFPSFTTAALVFVESGPIEITNTAFRGHSELFSSSVRSTDSTIRISYFHATEFNGGAVHAFRSSLVFSGNNSFTSNIAGNGSAIVAQDSTVNLNGQNSFLFNEGHQRDVYAPCGGAVYIINTEMVFNGTTVFMENKVTTSGSGGALCAIHSNLVFLGATKFSANSAATGGAIALVNGSMNLEGECEFSHHYSSGSGGAISMIDTYFGQLGTTAFLNNTALNGGSIYCESSSLVFAEDVIFSNNSATIAGGVIFASDSQIELQNSSTFQRNDAESQGGAIYSLNSRIRFAGEHELKLNFATQGGAISLISSDLILGLPLELRAECNRASYGGVIFVSETFSLLQCDQSVSMNTMDHPVCFLEAEADFNVSLIVEDNEASVSGPVLYGGNLDFCRFRVGTQDFGINALQYLRSILTSQQKYITNDNIATLITSDPSKMCFCNSTGIISCGLGTMITTQPGKLFTLSVVAVGQALSPVPSVIRSYFETAAGSKSFAVLGFQEQVQLTGLTCDALNYHIFSPNSTETLVLYPDGPCRDTGNASISIKVYLAPCPDGFQMEGSECRCDKTLQKYTNSCNIDDTTITRSGGFWFAGLYMCNGSLLFENIYIEPFNSAANCTLSYDGLFTHRRCPFDYCVTETVNVSLSDPDIQCSQNRTGILCGACVNGTSLLIGGFRCAKCTNDYLGLIVLFAAAGIGLVFVLFILKLTVAMGTINGLIFYANIVSVNRINFLPNEPANPLTVFIAWINLDFGIETCFYDGMDVYARTWLQFVFPFYLWGIVILIIIASRLSQKAAKMFGSNPVAVLATIFLLSYSKILRTVIIALSLTPVDYEDGIVWTVWLYDGNRPYFQQGHAPLGVVSVLILLFLFLPYTLFLLLLPWLQAFSDKKGFRWLNKTKPLADAYFAPYKKQTRYWTGCLLILRCVLFLIFALNFLGDQSVNLVSISSTVTLLLTVPWVSGSLYEKRYVNILEASYYLNLLIFSVGTFHVNAIEGNQAALAYTSISFALVTFIGVIIFHVYLQIKASKLWKCFTKTKKKEGDLSAIMNEAHMITDSSVTTTDLIIPEIGSDSGFLYHTTIPFRESLFENEELPN